MLRAAAQLFWDCHPGSVDFHAHTPLILERFLDLAGESCF
jgi:hypothetical protein